MSRSAVVEAGTMGVPRVVHSFLHQANCANPADRCFALRTFRSTGSLSARGNLVFLSEYRPNSSSLRSGVALLQDGISSPLLERHRRNDFARRSKPGIYTN